MSTPITDEEGDRAKGARRGRISAGRWRALAGTLAASLLSSSALAASAHAGAIIDNGTVQLGVHDLGQLNYPGGSPASDGFTTTVALRHMPTNSEMIGNNPYEGWGLADASSGITGYVNGSHPLFTDGVDLTSVSFSATATTATSVVDVVGDGPTPVPTFRITHEWRPSPDTPNLYEAKVTIKNISNATVQPRYRRTMDWDVWPNPNVEYVTIDGAPFSALLFTSNAGYAISDPLSGPQDYGHTGFFTDAGPQDHGALFDFGFPALAPDAEMTFFVYYGAAGNETDAVSAVQAVGAQTWSFGQGPALGGTPSTAIFAYTGGPSLASTCNGLTATIIGTSGPDVISGTGAADVISGLGGDDTITGANGNDTICGGSGDDTLTAGAGSDRLLGGPGSDQLAGDAGIDVLDGENGDDQLSGGAGKDQLVGDAGDDRLAGDADDDSLKGNAGIDQLVGGAGKDTLLGGDGVDRLEGGLGNDDLAGDDGNDRLMGEDGNDTLAGGADNDWVIGDIGADVLTGGGGNDWLIAGAGNDMLTGNAGNDWLIGDAGSDVLDALDGEIDELDCGANVDTTSADPADVLDSSCP